MPKICDNTSVAMLVKQGGKVLLIERKKYNPGFALPAGHQDGLPPEAAARKELIEEVGLTPGLMEKVLGKKLLNPCKREGGTHHFWTVFNVANWLGELKPSPDETKQAFWADDEQVRKLAKRLEDFMAEHNLSFDDFPGLVQATNEIQEWAENPGLEPPMYFIFKDLGII